LGRDLPAEFGRWKKRVRALCLVAVFAALAVDAKFDGCFSCLKASAQALCCLTSFNIKSMLTSVESATGAVSAFIKAQ